MIQGIGHIAIAVKDIKDFVGRFCTTFSVPMPEIRDVAEKRLKVAVIDLGNAQLEILEDYSNEGMIARCVREHGNNIHHFCLLSSDINGDVAAIGWNGVKLTDKAAKPGVRGKLIAFVAPEVLDGITVELSEV